jgi:hypothetical protein
MTINDKSQTFEDVRAALKCKERGNGQRLLGPNKTRGVRVLVPKDWRWLLTDFAVSIGAPFCSIN